MGQLLIHGHRTAAHCHSNSCNHHPRRNSLEYVETTQRGRAASRSSVRGRSGAAGVSVFPRPLGDPRAPVPRGARRGTLRALGGALAPSPPGPLCGPPRVFTANSHGPMCARPPRENPPNDRLHPTHDPGHRVPPDPDHPVPGPTPRLQFDYSWFGRRSPDGSSEASLSS
jgi:hypothetical protein